MNKANECTCPSGDGSLVHPCPAHPAVEQVGGDERAAFEAAFAAMGRPVCRADYDQDAYGTPFDDGGWTGWQARAALAQPSPASVCATPAGENCPGDGVKSCKKCPEQAEAERPEVVAYADPVAFATFKERGHEGGVAGREWMWAEPGAALVAMSRTDECERIVGALRAERDGAIKLLGQSVWQKIERLTQERDAALARVAELEMLLRKLSTNGLMQFSTVDEEMAVQAALGGAPVSQAQQLHDLDKQCRDDVARALGLRPSQERGFAWSYLLASIKSCVKASEDAAQAQHSVPGNAAALVRAEAKKYSLNAAGMLDSGAPEHAQTFAIVQLLSEFDDEEAESHWEAIMAYSDFRTSDALFRAAELLAAAPGTEVPQAWLDVQAERRRQVEAEGWTPEHDDEEHDDGGLADAASCYALSAAGWSTYAASERWPWPLEWWKPTTPRRDLVKACALALAEIERLDRAATGKEAV
ncbi:hypothetical protein AAA616_27185 [Pseudomonas aeruginosa]